MVREAHCAALALAADFAAAPADVVQVLFAAMEALD